ncbi:hypothetical protein C7M84_010847 [Penaeus vannamei]|uniref:Uncharacterized protein n=1 Tax=Penaeus vannamei TaxID=6689 RepID=A0A3R7T1I2_PENVA|nr:hypothetical protein C7M84_010847 [Penaeus vannamei]
MLNPTQDRTHLHLLLLLTTQTFHASLSSPLSFFFHVFLTLLSFSSPSLPLIIFVLSSLFLFLPLLFLPLLHSLVFIISLLLLYSPLSSSPAFHILSLPIRFSSSFLCSFYSSVIFISLFRLFRFPCFVFFFPFLSSFPFFLSPLSLPSLISSPSSSSFTFFFSLSSFFFFSSPSLPSLTFLSLFFLLPHFHFSFPNPFPPPLPLSSFPSFSPFIFLFPPLPLSFFSSLSLLPHFPSLFPLFPLPLPSSLTPLLPSPFPLPPPHSPSSFSHSLSFSLLLHSPSSLLPFPILLLFLHSPSLSHLETHLEVPDRPEPPRRTPSLHPLAGPPRRTPHRTPSLHPLPGPLAAPPPPHTDPSPDPQIAPSPPNLSQASERAFAVAFA